MSAEGSQGDELKHEVEALTQELKKVCDENSAMHATCEAHKCEAKALAKELEDAYLECGCQEVELQQAVVEIADYRVAVAEMETMLMDVLAGKAKLKVDKG